MNLNAHPLDPSTITPDKEKAILCAMYAIWKQKTRECKTDLNFEEWLKSGEKQFCTCSTDLKPLERNGHTASCNHAQRKAERVKPKKHTPIKRVSDKRKTENKQYSELRKQYLYDHPTCEIRLIGCTGKATEIHHCSTSHKDFLNTKTWKAVCAHCHNMIERVLSANDRRNKGLLI